MLLHEKLEDTKLPASVIEALRELKLDTPEKVVDASDVVLRRGKGIRVKELDAIRNAMRTPLGQALVPFIEAGASLQDASLEFYPDDARYVVGPEDAVVTLADFRRLFKVSTQGK